MPPPETESEIHPPTPMSEPNDTTEKALDELRELMRDVDNLLNTSKEKVDESVKKNSEKLNESLDSAKASASRAKESAAAGLEAARRAIHAYPVESAGVCFGVGLLLGILINRK